VNKSGDIAGKRPDWFRRNARWQRPRIFFAIQATACSRARLGDRMLWFESGTNSSSLAIFV